MTQLQQARKNIITQEMKQVAKDEDVDPEYIRRKISEGKVIIPVNRKRKATKFCGIGAGLKTKVNANIGTSPDYVNVEVELEKLNSIAKSHQVICITHLPQIASYAEEQLKVSKFVKNGKTYSTIESLSEESRLEEIADMIRGSEKTEITMKQAREMLQDAKRKIKSKG